MVTLDTGERARGLVLGAAVGDALGLPAEGLSKRRASRMFRGRPKHRFVLGAGMVSDDTDHLALVAQCLLAQPRDAMRFARRLSWRLRWWLLTLPAGIGLATLRAIVRMWIGFGPGNSGVRSAGNGAAMRVAPIGFVFAGDAEQRNEYVSAATVLTHTDPRALVGARVVVELVAWTVREQLSSRPELVRFIELLRSASEDAEWRGIVDTVEVAARADESVAQLAIDLGCEHGVTGYVYRTVPVAAYAWYRHFDDFESGLSAVLECGGDTDTVGAVFGAIAGATVGEAGIPEDWRAGIRDWPRGVGFFRELGDRLGQLRSGRESSPVGHAWPLLPVRNLVFLVLVLAHGFRRLLPPW